MAAFVVRPVNTVTGRGRSQQLPQASPKVHVLLGRIDFRGNQRKRTSSDSFPILFHQLKRALFIHGLVPKSEYLKIYEGLSLCSMIIRESQWPAQSHGKELPGRFTQAPQRPYGKDCSPFLIHEFNETPIQETEKFTIPPFDSAPGKNQW